MLDAIETLEAHPLRGAIPKDERLQQLGFRFLTVAPYLVFYKTKPREVRVYRVLDWKRAYEGML